MNEKQTTLATAIASLDAMIISAREQQISLAKMLAKEHGLPELLVLNAMKESSHEALTKN